MPPPGTRAGHYVTADFYGSAVASGTYSGGTIAIPMTAVPPPAPLGRQAPRQAPTPGPAFDVFVVTSAP